LRRIFMIDIAQDVFALVSVSTFLVSIAMWIAAF
jgi:hypothetical protein